MTFPAIGYLRKDVSGEQQRWDETQIRRLAKRLGYNLCKTIVFTDRTPNPVGQLINTATGTGAEALFVPSAEHFDGVVPADLVKVTDVIIVASQSTYARWPTGELPVLDR
ncbi:MAG: hypothetical protein J2P18_18540 [Nocardia sp.]|nr:hypothetical protein [Nocardia sp.]